VLADGLDVAQVMVSLLTAAQIRSTPAFVAIKSRDGVRVNPAMNAATGPTRSPRVVSLAAA
jgi:hypothetical protein